MFRILLLISIVFFSYKNQAQTIPKDSVIEIRIYFKQSNWDSILDKWKLNNVDKKLPADIIIGKKKIKGVGVKFKGNSSYNSDYKKNPLNIKLNQTDKKANFNGLSKIKLSNIFRDPSAIREVLAYEIAANYMNVSEAWFANVYVNDTLLGLYTLVEPINSDFTQKHYDIKNGIRIKCDPSSYNNNQCKERIYSTLVPAYTHNISCYKKAYDVKSKHGINKLYQLMLSLWYNFNQDSKYYHTIENYLDIDKALWMLAFNNIFVNLDSYSWSGHNYYMLETNEGLLAPHLWDLNECFGGFSIGYPFAKLPEIPILFQYDIKTKPLISILLHDSSYQKMYRTHCQTLYEDWIFSGKIETRAKELEQIIRPYVEKDPWFYYKADVYKFPLQKDYYNIPGLCKLMRKRKNYLTKEFQATKPELLKRKWNQNDSTITLNVTCNNADKVVLFYKKNRNDKFIKTEMKKIKGNTFHIELNKTNITTYYLFTENVQSGAFFPKEASHKPFIIKSN